MQIAAALAIILVVYLLLHWPSLSAEQQILDELATAQTAAEHHNVNGVMEIVSAHYQDSNGLNNDQLAFLLRRYAMGKDDVSVDVTTPNVQVQGDTAVSVSQLTIRALPDHSVLYSEPVTLHWKPENGTKWLIFPAKVWRVVSADYSLPGASDFL